MGAMGPMGPIRPMGLIGLIGLIVLLAGCSDDSQEERPLRQARMEVLSLVQQFDEIEPTVRTREWEDATRTWGPVTRTWGPVTRTWTPPSGFVRFDDLSYNAGKDFSDHSISVFLTRDAVQEGENIGNKVLRGLFSYYDGKWFTDLTIEKEDDYYVYGYYPSSGITPNIEPDGDNHLYADGAVLTLSNLPTATSSDICVIVGAKEGTASDVNTPFDQGWFKYHANPTHEPEEGHEDEFNANYVYLLFDHLYAVLNIQLRVDGDYDEMRTIKLKQISLKTKAGDVPTPSKVNARITLKKTTDGTSPITGDIEFTAAASDDGNGIIFYSEDGMTLTTSYGTYLGHFMPQHIDNLEVTSTYDVYDKKGNKIRQNETATNKLPISMFNDQTETKRKMIYTIKMTVRPTYLYRLSDQDIDSPTVTF